MLECEKLRSNSESVQLEETIPLLQKAPWQPWVRDELVTNTLSQLKRKYETLAKFDPTPQLCKAAKSDLGVSVAASAASVALPAHSQFPSEAQFKAAVRSAQEEAAEWKQKCEEQAQLHEARSRQSHHCKG